MPFDGSQEDHAPHPVDIAVGHRIRARRKAARISQSKLATHLGVSFQQVQKYERGTNRVSASKLAEIASTLETTVADLMGETGNADANPRMAALLAIPGALNLLEGFEQLPPNIRQAVVNFVREAGKKD